MNRDVCPRCGGETEFVQHGGEDNPVVKTTPDDVGDGLLELRWCNDCDAGLEYVLEATDVIVVTESDQ